jgi:salicylate hydroxylase
VVTYPLRAGRQVNFVAVEERQSWSAEGWTEADDPANLRRAFAGWGGPVEALLDAVEETFLWGLFDHPPLPRWVNGRIALLGDACHPMLPYLAQGATMALEDAWVLAAELDVAETPERGLLAYEARRAPRAARVQRASARNGRFFHLRPGLREAAHVGLRAASAMAPGLLMGRFDWLYGADVVSDRATG